MIYVIFDNSQEWDDYYNDNEVIKYVGTDRTEAEAYFHKYFDSYATLPNSKWHYCACLTEFEDGWDYYNPSKQYSKILLETDNSKNEENT